MALGNVAVERTEDGDLEVVMGPPKIELGQEWRDPARDSKRVKYAPCECGQTQPVISNFA